MFNPRIQRLERVLEGVAKVPAPTASDKDKVPTVNSDGDYVLEDIPKEVPVPTASDSGKAIVVGSDGKYKLDNVGGGSILEETGTWSWSGVSDASVTFAQALDAFEKGSPILCTDIANVTSGGLNSILVYPSGKARKLMIPSGSKTSLAFTAIIYYDAVVTIFSITYVSDGSVESFIAGLQTS